MLFTQMAKEIWWNQKIGGGATADLPGIPQSSLVDGFICCLVFIQPEWAEDENMDDDDDDDGDGDGDGGDADDDDDDE